MQVLIFSQKMTYFQTYFVIFIEPYSYLGLHEPRLIYKIYVLV